MDVPQGETNFHAKYFSVHGSAMGSTSYRNSVFSSVLEIFDSLATVKVDKMWTGLTSCLTFCSALNSHKTCCFDQKKSCTLYLLLVEKLQDENVEITLEPSRL